MSNENHNNLQPWKDKLERLGTLPGETLPDKNAMFEKVNAKLQVRKSRKSAMWYWIAAACVLFAFMIPLMIPNRENHQIANTGTKQNQPEAKQKQPEKQISVATANHKKDSITIANPVLSEKNIAIVSDKKNESVNKNIRENKKVKLRVSDTVSTQNQIAEKPDNSLQAIDSFSGFATTIPAKKRLPVVHINELGDPDNMPQVARNAEKPPVHFLQLGSQEVYHSSPVSITKNFATINFKTSPN